MAQINNQTEPYVAPEVVEYGKLTEITQEKTTAGYLDGSEDEYS